MEQLLEVGILVIVIVISCFAYYFGIVHSRQCEPINVSNHCGHVVTAPDVYDLNYEVVIVGSGVLGSAIGATLSQDGRNVLILERDLSEPDRIVGELLQPGGYLALKNLGLQDALKDIDAHIVCGYVVHDRSTKRNVTLSYPLNDNNEVMTGRSFHHGRFVMGLRKQARKHGATLVEGTVKSLLEDKKGTIVGVQFKDKQTNSIKSVNAQLTIVADGCFSKFRKSFNSSSVNVSSYFAGTLLHNCPQHKSGHAEILLTSCGPVLVYQISSTATRILCDIQGKFPSNIANFLEREIAPQLTDSMKEPFAKAMTAGDIRSMPNSHLSSSFCSKPGVLLLGDALNMRHPLTGAGMTVALNDVVMWRKMLRSEPDLNNHDSILQKQKEFLWKRKWSHSFVVNVLAQALYQLFAASDRNFLELRQACFEYFNLGGRAVSDPVGLLSVLHPNPIILISHFFAVSLYATYRIVRSCRVWHLHYGIYRSIAVFIKACQIIIPLIKSELF